MVSGQEFIPKNLARTSVDQHPHTHIYSLSLTQVTRNVLHCTLLDNEKGQKLKKQSLAAKTSDMALKRFDVENIISIRYPNGHVEQNICLSGLS
ncbi:hypothetical protein DERP_011350 [Dermatophagoides pteronyssinus]|uniref:Uncharacterized protein n=1 Tax=Dermatophagoides pteronyssinus TaxID=6956 RepID=A0ABQ8J7G1_DERPT|nr:hypothetical protein DERP_011350 [Dermatophagoides pteronyssinus]